MKKLLFSLLFLFFATDVLAAYVAVLETGADISAKDLVTLSDRQYLTNVLREEAVKQLPAIQNYTIMTRENIQQMLPPGKAIDECEGSCLVETGKNISADYVCQARVGSFGGDLTLSAELYETAGNKLIASFNGQGANVKELLLLIREKSADFFSVVKAIASPASEAAAQNESRSSRPDSVTVLANDAYAELDGNGSQESKQSKVGESIPANVGESTKKVVRWVPLSISAAATVAGAVLAVVGNNKAKNAHDAGFSNASEYQKNKDDAHSGQTLRGIGIGLAIAGAVGVGLSFVF